MKLLFCMKCFDVFKLTQHERQCECGNVSGRYINNSEAITNGGGVSLAIGNGSLLNAVYRLAAEEHNHERGYYIDNCRVEYCWVRPNSGEGNPHTTVRGESK